VVNEYHHKQSRKRESQYLLISDFIRGVTVEFEVAPGIFSYKRIDFGIKLLLEHVEIPSEGMVLDIGCGYGAIGITIAKLNPKLIVYMVDINSEATRLAKRNVLRNGLDPSRVIVLQGDLYDAVKGLTFDAIYSSPPPVAGLQIVERIIREAPQHLKPNGTLQLVMRKGYEKAKKLMQEVFGNVEIKVAKKGYRLLFSRKLI
jgi:16S rRNA G1207 methylase RsmC